MVSWQESETSSSADNKETGTNVIKLFFRKSWQDMEVH